jgi:quercetin dioxygenase-like cupin family protein
MATALWFAGTRVVVHARAADSQGRLRVWESDEPRGTALPLHVHANEDEQLVILEGEPTVRLGDAVHRLRAGDTLALPRGVPHAHRVTSQTARILTIATPGGCSSSSTARPAHHRHHRRPTKCSPPLFANSAGSAPGLRETLSDLRYSRDEVIRRAREFDPLPTGSRS